MNDVNLQLLRLLIAACQIPAREVSAVTGYSRAYISKVLSGKIMASDDFWRALNAGLCQGKFSAFLGYFFRCSRPNESLIQNAVESAMVHVA